MSFVLSYLQSIIEQEFDQRKKTWHRSRGEAASLTFMKIMKGGKKGPNGETSGLAHVGGSCSKVLQMSSLSVARPSADAVSCNRVSSKW